MAPEVLCGEQADERSDVFAIGLLLHEMLTGQPAFGGSSRASIIAAILEKQPPRIDDQPLALTRLVRGCLEKDREQRVQSAHDVALQLRWIAADRATPSADPAARLARRWITPALAAVATAAAMFGVFRLLPARSEPAAARPSVVRARIDLRAAPPFALGRFVPPIGSTSPLVALSHNGQTLVYVGTADGGTKLYRRTLASEVVEPIEGTDGAQYAFFSPDDEWIGFLTTDKVMKARATGGAAIALAALDTPIRARWLPSGLIYVFYGVMGANVMQISTDGRSSKLFSPPSRPVAFTDILPDGRHALGLQGSSQTTADFSLIVVADLLTGSIKRLVSGGYDARFVPPGYLVYARASELHAVRFDPKGMAIVGEPRVLQSHVAMDSWFPHAQYAISNNGILVYAAGSDRAAGRIATVDRSNRVDALPMPERLYGVFRLSPDDTRLATGVSGVNDSIWIWDMRRREGRQLPVAPGSALPSWTGDSQEIVFAAPSGDDRYHIARMRPEAPNPTVVFADGARSVMPHAVAPDLSAMYVFRDGAGGILTLGGATPAFREVPGGAAGDVSPDSKWLAFVSIRTGVRQVCVMRMDGSGEVFQISTDGGFEPVWCRKCPDLFYRIGWQWYSVRISLGDGVKWDTPRALWNTEFVDTSGRSYDVSSDGKRLFIVKPAAAAENDGVRIVYGWPALLDD